MQDFSSSVGGAANVPTTLAGMSTEDLEALKLKLERASTRFGSRASRATDSATGYEQHWGAADPGANAEAEAHTGIQEDQEALLKLVKEELKGRQNS